MIHYLSLPTWNLSFLSKLMSRTLLHEYVLRTDALFRRMMRSVALVPFFDLCLGIGISRKSIGTTFHSMTSRWLPTRRTMSARPGLLLGLVNWNSTCGRREGFLSSEK